jgi:hypothetical protein
MYLRSVSYEAAYHFFQARTTHYWNIRCLHPNLPSWLRLMTSYIKSISFELEWRERRG